MSEAKKEEMSGLLPPCLTLHMLRQGRFGKVGAGVGVGRAVSAPPWGREEGACS